MQRLQYGEGMSRSPALLSPALSTRWGAHNWPNLPRAKETPEALRAFFCWLPLPYLSNLSNLFREFIRNYRLREKHLRRWIGQNRLGRSDRLDKSPVVPPESCPPHVSMPTTRWITRAGAFSALWRGTRHRLRLNWGRGTCQLLWLRCCSSCTPRRRRLTTLILAATTLHFVFDFGELRRSLP
jgi:hypothetical protein